MLTTVAEAAAAGRPVWHVAVGWLTRTCVAGCCCCCCEAPWRPPCYSLPCLSPSPLPLLLLLQAESRGKLLEYVGVELHSMDQEVLEKAMVDHPSCPDKLLRFLRCEA